MPHGQGQAGARNLDVTISSLQRRSGSQISQFSYFCNFVKFSLPGVLRADTLPLMTPKRSSLKVPVPRPRGPSWLRNWLARHQHPFSFYIHLIGIPMVLASVPCLLLGMYWSAAALFVGGYFLQWLGHRVEGNDVGELIPIKRLLGLPVVEFGPTSQAEPIRVPSAADARQTDSSFGL